MTASAVARRSGASCCLQPRRRAGAAAAGDHACGVDRSGLDSRVGSGRERRSGRGRDGVRVRQFVGVRGDRSHGTLRAADVPARPVSAARAFVRVHRVARADRQRPAERAQRLVDCLCGTRRRRAISRRIRLPPRASASRSNLRRRRPRPTRREPPTRRGVDDHTAISRGGCVTRDAASSRRRRSPDESGRGACRTTQAVRCARSSATRRIARAHLAANFFAGTPFSGQVNLLTTGSFDSPQQLFSTDTFVAQHRLPARLARRSANTRDWTVRAALTQGDIASWIVAGDYVTRAPARHRYDIGLSYSTQRYDGGNFAALQTWPTAAGMPARSTASTPSR